MKSQRDSPVWEPDSAAIFAIALSLWEAIQAKAASDAKLNLSEACNGMDQFMREVMRVAGQFEAWACQFINFAEFEDVWPYRLQEDFGKACLALISPDQLSTFNDEACLCVALRLRLPLKLDKGLPVPVDLTADNPGYACGSKFCAFRIQTVRDGGDDQCVPFTLDDDPFDGNYGPPFFGLYGVGEDGLVEHIADRSSFAEMVVLAGNLVPGLKFGETFINHKERRERKEKSPIAGGFLVGGAATPPYPIKNDDWTGYSIYINSLCQRPVPVFTESAEGKDEKFVVFETELAGQKKIADNALIRLRQFLDGERDFVDAITVEEFLVPVKVHPDGSFTDEAGRRFGPGRE